MRQPFFVGLCTRGMAPLLQASITVSFDISRRRATVLGEKCGSNVTRLAMTSNNSPRDLLRSSRSISSLDLPINFAAMILGKKIK